jgi:hypothetical protein
LKARRSRGAPIAASRRPVVLPGDELAAPAQYRVGRHKAPERFKAATTHRPALRGEASSLVVREPEPSPAELLSQDPVLLLEVVDRLKLAAVHPPGHYHQQNLHRLGGHHRHRIVPTVLSDQLRTRGWYAMQRCKELRSLAVLRDPILAPDAVRPARQLVRGEYSSMSTRVPLRGGAKVEVEQAAEAFTPLDGRAVVRGWRAGREQLIVDALMVALSVVVLDELGDGQAKVALTRRRQLAQALALELDKTKRSAKALRFGLWAGSRRQFTPAASRRPWKSHARRARRRRGQPALR